MYEIDLDGKIVRPDEQMVDPALTAIKETQRQSKTSPSDLTVEQVKEAFGGLFEDVSFFSSLLDLAKDKERSELQTQPLSSKEDRTKVHQTLRTLFHGLLQSESIGDHIRIYNRNAASDRQNDNRRDDRNVQAPDQCRFLQFTLYKENMDTIEAIQMMARRLHMNAKDFSFAGTKDRRGCTAQKIVARNVTVNKIMGINKLFDDGRLKVSSLSLASAPLNLGDLKGNHFEIVLRDVSGCTDEQMIGRFEYFKTHGFINYFGLQRFGTGSVPSHSIGQALLRGEWKRAVELILDPRKGEEDERAIEARLKWKEGDMKTAHALFPSRFTAERQILAHFSRDPQNINDHLGALLSINRELRLMYVHSVQSWIWNQMVSLRHSIFGQSLHIGDLVLDKNDNPVLVTRENICSLSIRDLVLPLPGYSSQYPSNEIGQKYENLLAQALPSDDLAAVFKPKVKALWDLPGAYRRVYILPEHSQLKVINYSDPDETLDFISSADAINGSHKALLITFSLPSSCYATMALRELMRIGTDPKEHKTKTKRHKSTL